MTHIYLIRHGESLANAARLFIGHTDMDLTERGHRQAEKTAQYLKSVPVDAIYASDLCRAYHTALHTADLLGMAAVPDQGLREIYAGEWEGMPFDRLMTQYPHEFAELWRTRIGEARCKGGESIAELAARISAAVERLVRANEGKTVLLFSHATPIRILGTLWQGLPLSEMHTVPWAANASVTHGTFDGTNYRLISYGEADFGSEPA